MHGCKLAALIAVAVVAAAAPAQASTLSWSYPAPIDNVKPAGVTYGVISASCPSTALCVVTDERGNIYASTDPLGGPDAWTVTAAVPGVLLWDVSCPSTALCVAVDDRGDVLSSTDPAAGDWTVTAVDAFVRIRNVECPTTTLCVATDGNSNVLTSTDPAGGAGAWTSTSIGHELTGLSCPTTTLCVGTADFNTVETSTNPTGGSGAWTSFGINGVYFAGTVSCPSTSFCALTDNAGAVATATNPTGGTAAWTATSLGESNRFTISCPSSSLCLASEYAGYVYRSTNPGAATPVWSSTRISDDGARPVCQSTTFCLALTGDDLGAILTTTDPTGDASAWSRTSFAGLGYDSLLAAACPSAVLCLAADDIGGVFSSADPRGAADAWAVTDLSGLGVDSVLGLACPSAGLCVATDRLGNAAWSADPGDASPVWHAATIDAGHQLRGVDCPSVTLCVAIDDAGQVLTTNTPAGGQWTAAAVDSGVAINAVSCASNSLCVAVDDQGRALTSTDPTGGAGAWAPQDRIGGSATPLLGISCRSASLCVAVDADGRILTSLAPARAVPWSVVQRGAGELTSVSCPSASLCLAADDAGRVLSSTFPASTDAGAWNEEIETEGPVLTVACAHEASCVAGDALGYVEGGVLGDAPLNTQQPELTGIAAPGNTLTCSPGVWSGAQPQSYAFRWRRGGNAIPGATAPTYVVQDFDAGANVGCLVTASNNSGAATANSAVLAVLKKPRAINSAQITGTAAVGATLSCAASFDGSPPLAILFSWTRDATTVGLPAVANSYTVQTADAGHLLTCIATATNTVGTATAKSAPLGIPRIAPVGFAARITPRAVGLRSLLRHGLPVTVQCTGRCSIRLRITLPRGRRAPRLAGERTVTLPAAARRVVHVRLTRRARALVAHSRTVRVRVTAHEFYGRHVAGAATVVIRRR